MKKLLFIFALMIVSSSVWAQKMVVTFNHEADSQNDPGKLVSVKITIEGDSVILKSENKEAVWEIEDSVVITKLQIVEHPKLVKCSAETIGNIKAKRLKGIYLIRNGNKTELLTSYCKDKNHNDGTNVNIIFLSGDTIMLRRNTDTISIEIKQIQGFNPLAWTEDSIKELFISCNGIGSSKPYEVCKDTVFKANISCLYGNGLGVSDCSMLIGKDTIPGIIGQDSVSFKLPIRLKAISDKDSLPMSIVFSVSDTAGQKLFEGKSLSVAYGKIQKKPTNPNMVDKLLEWVRAHNVVSTIAIIALCLIIIIIIIHHVTQKGKKNPVEFKDSEGNTIQVFCQKEINKPNVGDKVKTDKEGFAITQDGVYAFDIEKKGQIKNIAKVYYVVPMGNGDSIYVDKDTLTGDDSSNSYKCTLPDKTPITIVSGAKTKYPGGEYEIDGGRILKIEEKEDGNCIQIISKHNPDESEGSSQLPVTSDTETVTTTDEFEQDKVEKKMLEARISELESELERCPTQKEKEDLLRQLNDAKSNTKQIELQAREDERKKVNLEYMEKIAKEYVSKKKYNEDTGGLRTQVNNANAAKKKAEKEVQSKNADVIKLEAKVKDLRKELNDKDEEIVHEKASVAALRKSALKKNVHYLLKVQDVLDDISNSIADVYKDMTNSKIKEGLVSPIVKGVSGLSSGVLSWGEDYKTNIMSNMEAFFGKDVLTMDEDEVKEKLAKDFVSTVVKSDGFSKLVRLYHLSLVPFIRKQFEDGGMNTMILEQLYYRTYMLVSDFGYTIQCPMLFKDQYDENNYISCSSTSLFKYVTLSEEDKIHVKAKGINVIIDVTQIGYSSQRGSRKATVVTPDF